jgi:hypothetical protein
VRRFAARVGAAPAAQQQHAAAGGRLKLVRIPGQKG